MNIYVIDISVVFIKFMLLFTFNLGAYSANAMAMTARPMVRQNSKPRLKVQGVYGYAMPMSMIIPGIDYGLYDYDMSVIYYNTVTM